jgi:hypothetical protein
MWLGIMYVTGRRHELFAIKLEHNYTTCLVITAMIIMFTIEDV